MLIIILGVIDLFAGILLIFGRAIDFPNQILMIIGIILLAKSSLGILKDFASWVDFLAGIILLLSIIIQVPLFITIILGILIVQKGAFSFV